MTAALLLLIPVIIISLFCVGLVALSRNIAFAVRVYFSLAIIFVIGWLTTLLFSNVDSSLTLFCNRAVYVSPILALLFFGLFIDASYFRDKRFRLLNITSVVAAVAGSVVALTKLSIESVEPRVQEGVVVGFNVVPGPLIWLVSVVTVFLSGALFARLIVAYRVTEESKKRPLKLIFASLVMAIIVSIIANLVLPIVVGGSGLANAITNIAIIIFVGSVAYSVLRYSFLDIRLLVVRSVAYVAVLTGLLILTTGLEILFFNILNVGERPVDNQQLLVFALFLSLAALSFSPLRGLLAHTTAKIFFKDTYEPSDLIGRFNSNLVNNIDIEKLLSSSSELISKTLKTTFCVIEVEQTKNTLRYSSGSRKFDEKAEKGLLYNASRSTSRIVIKQLISQSGSDSRRGVVDAMQEYDIEVFIALASSNEKRKVGYIALGPKKNGEVYNKTDTDVLVILANELALAVQNALRFKEIEKFNITLRQKVEDATRELRRKNERLRVLDQTKDDFISMASHQLRTPLTSVKGYVSMVLDGDAGKVTELQKKLLTQSFLSSQRMVYLISDLLNVSRLRTGKFVIEPVETNLSDVIESEVEQLQETAKGRELTLTFNKPPHFPTLMIDENKLRQVIMNFIDNAIYYTPAKGHITVNLVDRPDSIEFTVVDDGIGVPKAEQHHLFSKFYRAHNAKRARPDGTGLGLFMAKKVIIAQGGAVIFKSQEGKGSTFGFTFPKKKLLTKDKIALESSKKG